MILLHPVACPPDLIDTNCPGCRASFPISCVSRVTTREGLDSLLGGTLNSARCPSCDTRVVSDRPVHIDMPELGVGCLRYAPIDLLENDAVCEQLLVDSHYQLVFYSLDELARQVQARVRLSRFAHNGFNSDD